MITIDSVFSKKNINAAIMHFSNGNKQKGLLEVFVILAYDVNQKRVGKLKRLKEEIKRTIDVENDSICIYTMLSLQNMGKEQIGITEDHSAII